jgi:tetratricopeptide (TPR) repeat protein
MNTTSKVNNLTEFQIHQILMMSSLVYENMAQIYTLRNEFDLAEIHCERALHYARMYEGKGDFYEALLLKALYAFHRLKLQQSNFADAFKFAEEAYNYVAIAYNPVHPEVQKAAVSLIECLTHKGDFDQAETFAQMTLDSLTDPANGLDQNSDEVSIGYYQLGKLIHAQNGDLVKAERLARESLRIQYLIYGSNTPGVHVGNCMGLLANVLTSQGKRGSEPKELLERCLAIDIEYYGSNGANTAVAYMNLGEFYHKSASEILLLLDGRETYSNKYFHSTMETVINHFHLAEFNFKEALRIYAKIHGPKGSRVLTVASHIGSVKSSMEAISTPEFLTFLKYASRLRLAGQGFRG